MEKAIAKVLARKEYALKTFLVIVLSVILIAVLAISIIKKDSGSTIISTVNILFMIIIFILLQIEKKRRTKELEEKIKEG